MRRYDTLLKNTKNAREDLRRRNPGKSEAEIDNIAIKEQIDDLAAKLSDQESFSKMTNYEKRGAMKDYLFLKSMQQPSINAQVGSLLHKMMSEAQSKLKKSAAKLDKNGDCTGCAKDVARVLAVRSVIDSINSAPKRKSEPINKVEFIKAVKIRTAAYMERDDFKYMISGMTPKKAVESSKNNDGMLKEKLSAADKELSKLQKQVERTKSEPILEKRRVSVLGG